ncbi:pro-sigmaK processing inhibitor BofA family protein [Fictibacillus aquaticus]|jgi:inhibitor of the pro-sigma K processing machinery|uniref:Transcriptional regulator n=1 Tax=Fictibacillus aquaticus TaxID=2021314 RepID=A0A235F5M6_9BACL|nr:pro-sigmaK processing inhibitor BofA family protein [Fictibacillus aquaticus]OYD56227.1 transcriptional regulator [Fictibacillus aquaticus]
MEPLIVIGVLGGMIMVLLLIGAPVRPLRWAGTALTRLCMGALFLFFLNAFGASSDLHIPINGTTAAVTAVLGLPGLASLAAIHYFVL